MLRISVPEWWVGNAFIARLVPEWWVYCTFTTHAVPEWWVYSALIAQLEPEWWFLCYLKKRTWYHDCGFVDFLWRIWCPNNALIILYSNFGARMVVL